MVWSGNGSIHTVKPTNAQMLKLHSLRTICHNSDMFKSVLIILAQLLNIITAYIKTQMDY